MKHFLLLASSFCLTLTANGQNYRGSDVDKMMYQRYQQHSQQNSNGNTYTPRTYNNGSNNYEDQNHSNNNYTQSYGNVGMEKVIQGVYVYNNQLALIRLKYSNGKITHYSTSRDITGNEQWQTMYPDNPHPTMEITDGQLAREYKYKVTIQRTTVYFNL